MSAVAAAPTAPATPRNTEVVMPRLSDSMEEGTIVAWLVAVGEAVAAGDPLVEIETDKATLTYDADTAGTLLTIHAGPGDTLPIGAVIATIGDPERAASRDGAPAGRRIAASPVARRLAEAARIDLGDVVATGPRGRISKEDVERAIAAQPDRPATAPAAPAAAATPAPAVAPEPPAGAGSRVVPLTAAQRTVARRMAESRAAIPEFTVSADATMDAALALRDEIAATLGEDRRAPSVNDLVIKACALALREHPRANAAFRDDAVELFERVNVGFAVAAPGTLVVPTVSDADVRPLTAIAAETARLAGRVRDGSITPAEVGGGTFTVSNLGMLGVEEFTAVINPPQVAILAVGALRRVAAPGDGDAIVAQTRMRLTLSCDHRVLFGADSAALLAAIRSLLERPIGLLL